jgi:hypothetical protein
MSIHYFFQTNGVARFGGLNFVSFSYLEGTNYQCVIFIYIQGANTIFVHFVFYIP